MDEKPLIHGLWRDDPATPEGKYLVKRRDGTVVEWPSFTLGAETRARRLRCERMRNRRLSSVTLDTLRR